LAAKPLARANCRAGAGNAAWIVSQVDFVAKVMGMAVTSGEVSNTDGMLVSGFD
jgi:hypothetical protein